MARKIHMSNPTPDGSKDPKKSLKLLDPLHNLTVDNKHTNKAKKNQSNGDQTRKTEEVVCQVSSIRNNGPGIVARLMGITDLPLDLGTQIQTTGSHKLNQTKKQNDRTPIFVRRHEQQKELQNSKKDFSMWEVSECRVTDVGSIQRFGINNSTKSTDSQQLERKENKLMIIPKESKTSTNIHSYDSSKPKRIVILKPGPDQSGSETDDCPSSSASSAGRYNNIEDFLNEVKKRLPQRKYETIFESMNRERQFDPRKIAKHVANQVRDSYKSNISADDPSLTGFVKSDRMRKYTELEPSQSICSSYTDRGSVTGTTTTDGNMLRVGDKREHIFRQFGSCRHIVSDDVICPHELSSRNLVRSLSAPVKGETFVKVVPEDNRFLNVAHRVGEATYEDVKEPKKFTFREKISNFRQSFRFGGGLFGRKLQQTVCDPCTYGGDSMADIMSGPTVVRRPGDVHENFTEVPPSPVSVCSSSEYDDEFSDDPAPSSDLSFPEHDSVSEKKDLRFYDQDKQGDAGYESESGQNKVEGGREESEHRLHELTDEVISSIIGLSTAPRNMWGRRTAQLQNGRKIVDIVWDAVKEYINPKKDMNEVDGVGEEVEQLIIEEMVDEISMEMMPQLNDLSVNHFHIKAFSQLC